MTDAIYAKIAQFTLTSDISGREQAFAKRIAERFAQSVPNAVNTAVHEGYVSAQLGNDPGKPNLLFCAHIDVVGFLVTDITADGFLRIGPVGGIDRRLLLGQPVMIWGKKHIFGVISILPPHLMQGDQAVPEWGSLCVDTGYDSAEALSDKVSRGDAVTFCDNEQRLLGNRISGAGLDNRAGAAAVMLAAETLGQCGELPCNLTFAFSFQEERSGRGAKLAAANLKPDIAIAVDTTFAMAHGEDPQECFPLGSGAAIGISPVLSKALSDRLIRTAQQHEIPWTAEIMTSTTGTDADALALAPGGCAAGTVSIPIRNMHTPVEVLDLADVQSTVDLLVSFAKECDAAWL